MRRSRMSSLGFVALRFDIFRTCAMRKRNLTTICTKRRITPVASVSVFLPLCVVCSLCQDNNVRTTQYSTAHHEAAAHVLAGEQAVELSIPERICSSVIRVGLVGRPRPPLAACLSPHEGTHPKSQLGGLLSLQRYHQ